MEYLAYKIEERKHNIRFPVHTKGEKSHIYIDTRPIIPLQEFFNYTIDKTYDRVEYFISEK